MKNKTQIGFLIILAAAIFYALAFIIWPALAVLSKQETTHPEQVVQEFYKWYLSYQGNPLSSRAFRSSPQLSQNMIDNLERALQGGLMFDPVLCAQDKPTTIQTSPAQISGGEALVQVKTSFADHSFVVKLVQVDGDWLIDQVECQR